MSDTAAKPSTSTRLRSLDALRGFDKFWLFGAGMACVTLGWWWDWQFLVVKKIWKSSDVLVVGGYSALLLGGFYRVVAV